METKSELGDEEAGSDEGEEAGREDESGILLENVDD